MNKLQSGQQCVLKDLFSEKKKIIIPDLQRDYCWGGKKHGNNVDNIELVSNFINGLMELYETSSEKEHQLGMIYAYENPTNHIQLCDGQQRITTLFLLLGMLNKKSGNGDLNQFPFAQSEDTEPILQYAIRESTLYFLSDLVSVFFDNNNEVIVNDLKKQRWYFSEYDLDPSIQSMLSALEIIEKKLREKEADFISYFRVFILEKLKFFYFDMKDREHGENMFVIINTTGEPLTPTENIKPFLIGNINESKRYCCSKKWEKWENYFWENKLDNEHEADNGLNDFFGWYWQIKNKQENVNSNKLFRQETNNVKLVELIDEIDIYFEQYKQLCNNFKKEENLEIFSKLLSDLDRPRKQSNEFIKNIIIPLLSFMVKFREQKEEHKLFLRRIRKNYYDGIWDDRNKNYVDWRNILEIIEKENSLEEILTFEKNINSLTKFEKSHPENWYNEEEKIKEKLKGESQSEIEKIEDYIDFMGDLSLLIHDEYNTVNDLDRRFKNYKNTIERIKNKNEEEFEMSNLFRLFYLFSGCHSVGHMERVTWEAEGVLFSTVDRLHFNNNCFKKLLFSDDIKEDIKVYLNEKIMKDDFWVLTEKNFSTDRAIKIWLTLKVINANQEKVTLSYFDGNNTGVAVYYDISKLDRNNKLIDSEPISIFNYICGFGVKAGVRGSYIHYTDQNLWEKNNIIDTPFSFVSYAKEERTKDQLSNHKKYIERLIEIGIK